MNTEYYYLDQLIFGYFNQDCSMEGSTIEEILGSYLVVDSPDLFNGLVQDINQYFEQNDSVIEEDFYNRYHWEFNPTHWNTTAKGFLTFVQEKTTTHLKQHYS